MIALDEDGGVLAGRHGSSILPSHPPGGATATLAKR
jgi:hypothetical protein